MSKYLVETFYTCSFKVKHFLDKIDEKELNSLEQRDDGIFEVIDIPNPLASIFATPPSK